MPRGLPGEGAWQGRSPYQRELAVLSVCSASPAQTPLWPSEVCGSSVL